MAVKIRRRFSASIVTIALTIALTLPVEVVLLEALAAPDEGVAIQKWVDGLSLGDLDRVADRVAFYPVAYRKQVMGALTPVRRSEVWRDFIRTYIAERPGLSNDVIPALEAAIELATPEALSNPTAADRAQIRLVAEQIEQLLGRDEAEYLLYRIGPRDEFQVATAEPLRMRLSNYVRSLMVASARVQGCNCALSWGCDGYSTHCSSLLECTPDEEWPMCGWLWDDSCNGRCAAGMDGS